MYKLYYKLLTESFYKSYSMIYWEYIWIEMTQICYIICVENEAYIDDYFTGQIILYHAMSNIDKLSYGYYNDIASFYINMTGGVLPSTINIKYEFFNKLAEYSNPITT